MTYTNDAGLIFDDDRVPAEDCCLAGFKSEPIDTALLMACKQRYFWDLSAEACILKVSSSEGHKKVGVTPDIDGCCREMAEIENPNDSIIQKP